MTTKEQERKALDQIRKIVESLGANSYIATAFDGCFEVAESNIENDWACSMKEQAENAQKKAEALESLANDLGEKLSSAYKTIEINHETAINDVRRLEEELKYAKSHMISYELYHELRIHFDDETEKGKAELLRVADVMAYYSDTPEEIAFQNAVKMYKTAKDHINDCEWFVKSLEAIKQEDPKAYD